MIDKTPEAKKEKRYKYRSALESRKDYLANLGWTNDCTKEEYKKHFDPLLSRSLEQFILMRKEVV